VEVIKRNHRQERIGTVVSDKMDKTIVVSVERRITHPMFHKIITRNSKFMVHDEERTAKIGDIVKVMETRPLSKNKRWRLVEVIRRVE
jgi:small subunit ribosomal protein S17